MALRTLIAACLLTSVVNAAEPESPAPAPARLSEAEQDRAEAATRFALGKTLFERGDSRGALRAYQRAWRWDPTRVELLDEIVPLAVSLGLSGEASRYAMIQAELGDPPPELLRRLALYASESRDWKKAAELYRLWLASSPRRTSRFEMNLVKIELGRLYSLINEPLAASDAVADVQQELLERPDSDETRRLSGALGGSLLQAFEAFGEIHLDAARWDRAQHAFDAMLALEPHAPAGHFCLARLAVERSRPVDAYEHLKAYFDQPAEPYGDAPYRLLRTALVQLNDKERLATELTRLRERRPDSPFATHADAQRLIEAGDDEQAAATARLALRQLAAHSGAVDPSVVEELSDWLLRRFVKLDQPNNLLPLVEELAAIDPTLELAADPIRRAMQNERFASEVRYRLELLLANQAAAGELANASRVALLGGFYELAVKLLQQAQPALGADASEPTLTLAVDLLLEDQNQPAADLLRHALDNGAVDQDDAAAWYYLSAAHALADQPDEALAAARRAAELEPDSLQFAMRVPWVLQRADRQQLAADEYRQLIETFADAPDASSRELLREARQTYSYLLLELGDYDESVEQLQLVLDEFPRDPGAANDLGYLWADRGEHLARALELVRLAVAAEPDNAAYLDSLGWANFRLGRLDDAVAALRRAADASAAPDAEILNHLAQALDAAGDTPAAIHAWRSALSAAQQADGREQLADEIQASLASRAPPDPDPGAEPDRAAPEPTPTEPE